MTRVFLVCSGLGTVRRGYEAFFRECFEALDEEGSLDMWLYKGAGPSGWQEVPLAHLSRSGFGARLIGELFHRGPYVVEQATLAASLLPHLQRRQPDVVYYCDPTIGKLLWRWRRLTGARYSLVLHNGGPHEPPYTWCDHVHQLTPAAVTEAINAGESPARQTLLPCGFRFGPIPRRPSTEERAARRLALGLPGDRPVVLSVGALNRGHKRMDYLIREVASLPAPRPMLVMLGEAETETPAVRAMAELLLGTDGFTMGTVSAEQVRAYYGAADVFALASLREAFGLVYVEATAHGLPCVAHDDAVTRYVLNGEGLLADLSQPGALAAQLQSALAQPDTLEARVRRHFSVRKRFDWQELAPDYVTMFERCVARAPAAAPKVQEAIRVAAGGAG